jgi:hypothetical protein
MLLTLMEQLQQQPTRNAAAASLAGAPPGLVAGRRLAQSVRFQTPAPAAGRTWGDVLGDDEEDYEYEPPPSTAAERRPTGISVSAQMRAPAEHRRRSR